jgi:hypothetical protein
MIVGECMAKHYGLFTGEHEAAGQVGRVRMSSIIDRPTSRLSTRSSTLPAVVLLTNKKLNVPIINNKRTALQRINIPPKRRSRATAQRDGSSKK